MTGQAWGAFDSNAAEHERLAGTEGMTVRAEPDAPASRNPGGRSRRGTAGDEPGTEQGSGAL
jgi:hypothetical protein